MKEMMPFASSWALFLTIGWCHYGSGQAAMTWFRTLQDPSSSQSFCPTNNLNFCDDPYSPLISSGLTIPCNKNTCAWNLDALHPSRPPPLCRSITIDLNQVSKLADILEPCLWWDLKYGVLKSSNAPSQSVVPVEAPSSNPVIALSLEPTVVASLFPSDTVSGPPSVAVSGSPSVAASDTPSRWPVPDPPSDVPSDAPSFSPSDRPSLVPSVSSFPSLVPIAAPSSVPSEVESSAPTLVEGLPRSTPTNTRAPTRTSSHNVAMDPMLVSYWIAPLSTRRKGLRRMLQSSPANNNPISLVDRQELTTLTQLHLLTELRLLLGQAKYVHSVKLSIATNQTTLLPNQTVIDTESLTGVVLFSAALGQPRSATVTQLIQQSLQGAALGRYLTLLSSALDPALKRTYGVFLGGPPVVPPGTGGTAASSSGLVEPNSGSDSGSDGQNEWYDKAYKKLKDPQGWDILMVAIIGGGCAAILSVCLVTAMVYRQRRRQHRFLHLQAKPTDSNDSGKEQEPDTEGEDTGHSLEGPLRPPRMAGEAAGYESEVTSVYSYLENNVSMMDDQSYSLAPSYLYGQAAGDDDASQNPSVMWSLVDGLGGNETNRTPEHSPHRLVVTTSQRPDGDKDQVLIFSDEDDDMSLASTLVPPQALNFDDKAEESRKNLNLPSLAMDSQQVYQNNSTPALTRDTTSRDGPTKMAITETDRVLEDAGKESSFASSAGDSQLTRQTANHDLKGAPSGEFSDDEESLFQGPAVASGSDGSQSARSSVVSLPSKDQRTEGRRGPLPMGGKQLTLQERKRLGMFTRISHHDETDDESFKLPAYYMPSDGKHQDDGTISSADMDSIG